jgi:uncharacterized protein (DUF433 family)
MTNPTLTINLEKYIERRLFGSRPHVRGRRIPVAVIAYTARDNDHGVKELMYDFTLSETEVLAALLYYAEHKAEIDAQQAEEARLFDIEYQKQHGND